MVTVPLYTVVILGEILLSHWQNRHFYTVKDTITNLYLMLLNMGLDVLVRTAVLAFLLWLGDYKLFDIQTAVPAWAYWTLLFLGEDLAFYWLHRIDHHSRFFWAVHVTHHSSEHFNLTTGFRSSVFQPLYRFVYFVPLILVGFSPLDIFLMYSVTQIYGILVHTQFIDKMGILEYILVTPSHHRVHHASNVPYLDKNLGMCLIIWDKLFGTFAPEDPAEPVRYGLHKNLDDSQRTPLNIVFHEWKNIARDVQKPVSLMDKLRYMFAPPGWSHDGSTQTAEELRKDYKHKM